MSLNLLLRTTRPFLFDEDASGTGGGGVAPSPSPSSAPAPSASPTPSPSSPEPSSTPSPGGAPKDDSSNDKDAFVLPDFSGNDDLDNLGNDAVVVPEPGAKPPGEPAVVPPVAPPVPAPQQPPAAQPPAPVAQPPAPAVAPVAEDRPLDPTNPAEVAQMLFANRDAAVQGLAASMYTLSPEEVEGLENNAVGTIPTLLARVHTNVAMATLNRMAEMVPHIIQRHLQAVGRNSDNASAFYEANKQLDRTKPEVSSAVASMARVYRAQNPNANKADMIKAVGLLVSQQLGIPITPAAAPSPVAQQPAGFVPAATGGGGITPPALAPDPWAGLAADYDEE